MVRLGNTEIESKTFLLGILILLVLIILFLAYLPTNDVSDIESEGNNISKIEEEVIVEKTSQQLQQEADLRNQELIEEAGPCLNLYGIDLDLCEAEFNCKNDQCIYDLAFEKKSTKVCYEIKERDLAIKCSIEITFELILDEALEKKDITICEKFSSESDVELCKEAYNSNGGI